MRLLLVEDEAGIADLIRQGLQEAHYTVHVARDGQTGLEMAEQQNYHLIILDVMLPKRDGWSVCAELRAQGDNTPVLMLTARDTVQDRVHGLDNGADDYLAKPFDFQELLARIRALLRRDKIHRARIIRVGDLQINTEQRRVLRADKEILLSHREYELLAALAAQESRVLTREAIQERVWMNEEATPNTVNVYIGMLRKKIDADHAVKLIHTIHGAGYSLRLPDSEAHL